MNVKDVTTVVETLTAFVNCTAGVLWVCLALLIMAALLSRERES